MANQLNLWIAILILDLAALTRLTPVFADQSNHATPDEVPFELRHGHHVIVKGSLPGLDRELNLLIDTGASCTFVNRKLVQRAGLQKLPDIGIRAAALGHGLKAQRVILRDLHLGHRVISRTCLAADLPWEGIDIVVGLDILRGTSLTIDYQSSKVVFGGRPVTAQTVALESDEGLLVVPVTMNGKTLRLAVDTGAHLSAVYEQRGDNWRKVAIGQKWVSVAHSGGFVQARQFTLSTARIETVELSRLTVVVLESENRSSRIDGFLSTSSLGVKQIHLDFHNRAFSLQQN
jgi:predicted aspartyl protease